MGQWLQLPLALLYKLPDVVARAVLGEVTYVSFSFASWPSLQHPGGTLALRKHCLLFPFGFSSKGALFLEALNLNHSCKGSGPGHHKFPCKGHHPHHKGKFYMCRKLYMSKSLSSFGSHCSLVAFRALYRAISENVDQPLLSLSSIAFGPQTIGSFNSLLEVDHRSAISRATLQKISCIETLRGFLSCIRIADRGIAASSHVRLGIQLAGTFWDLKDTHSA